MTLSDVRQRYRDFFKERGHAVIPSAPLVPENDPTTLFTGSGMQPLLPYLLGEKHPQGVRLVDSQKCFRAEDIEEVGDNRHTTFFEMLGNWSLGDYFKREQLSWFFEFLTGEIGLPPERLYVTVFAGDENLGIPKDDESVLIWQELFKGKGIEAPDVYIGSEDEGGAKGMQGGRIFYYDAKKNWWSRSGPPQSMPAGEPGGPDSEVFFDFGTAHDPKYGEHCHPNCDCGRFMEIGNSVFMEYMKEPSGTFAKLPQQNVDFGGGLERIAAASANDPDVFNVDVFDTVRREMEQILDVNYADNKAAFRVILDHMRAAVFLIADGVEPSNKDQGYFVRRLIRRSAMKVRNLRVGQFFALGTVANLIAQAYQESYPTLIKQVDHIDKVITDEETKFRSTLGMGLIEFEKRVSKTQKQGSDVLSADDTSVLFTTFGFPIELIQELAEERGLLVDLDGFKAEMRKHQIKSRSGAEQKFKGGLAEHSEKTTMLHTATHLMLAALRKYLGEHVHQAGSNITGKRTRFDFTHPEKVDEEVLRKVEAYVNEAIASKADMLIEEMPKEEAKALGVEGSFWERYPETVHVYTLKDRNGTVWSRELCGGPHVKNTGEIEGVFRIRKEESSAAGIRRIKATLE